MLQLKNITKNYAEGTNTVRALRGVSLNFREHEFVAILGQSGCGKTTMLNIIGGLDQYTDGDLIIDGTSTKHFKDRDWDTYRNHSIGFVFQSYHLIPHQSVLRNVELALSLSGVSRTERRRRAKEALEQVGLGDQLRKRPNEMSGGQMQRVAIARALVNNPDIILADEPTGALDTETSVQVMDILKEVSRDRLVIMVTHNPDLAERYATRTINMLDGVITGDSNPMTEEELQANLEKDAQKAASKTKKKMPSMSIFTSFGLSLNNLFTKKGRTLLTSFAGSIGIIGIALIYAVSQGTTAYINNVQEDTLSSYPLTIEASTLDVTTLMQTFMGVASDTTNAHEKDAVYSQSVLFDMFNALNNIESTENDLESFKAYIETEIAKDEEEGSLKQALSGVSYTYDLDLLVYTKNVDGTIIRSDTEELLMDAIEENFGTSMADAMSLSPMMSSSAISLPGTSVDLWCEMLSGKDGSLISPILEKQYDLIYGSWPNDYNEVVLVVDENNELDDMTLYALGLESKEEIDQVLQAVKNGTDIKTSQKKWSYKEICGMNFRVILNSDCYRLDENTGLYTDLRDTEAGLRYLYDNGMDLKVTGILRPNEDAASAMLTGTIAYTKALTEYVVGQMEESDALAAQQDSPDIDIFTGLPFRADTADMTDEEIEQEFRNYIDGLNQPEKASAYVRILSIPTREQLDTAIAQATDGKSRSELEAMLVQVLQQQMGMPEEEIRSYTEKMTDEELLDAYGQMVTESVKAQQAAQVMQQTAAMEPAQLAAALDAAMPDYTTEQCVQYYNEVPEFSETTLEENLDMLGLVDLNSPATVNLYASSFENKDVIEEYIADYNDSVEELKQIHYTDYVGLIMSSVTTIINAISYVLIAFVSISLVVSSIMIGVITLISVQERTKEIGILRAIGASKANVSSMFNAETVMIGFASGLIGVGMTWVLCIPVNAIVQYFTKIDNLRAVLPIPAAVVLVAISVALTLLSGLIPSRSAAKKDPVVALRTE